eukprot:2234948-Prymnesium_polylepis.1
MRPLDSSTGLTPSRAHVPLAPSQPRPVPAHGRRSGSGHTVGGADSAAAYWSPTEAASSRRTASQLRGAEPSTPRSQGATKVSHPAASTYSKPHMFRRVAAARSRESSANGSSSAWPACCSRRREASNGRIGVLVPDEEAAPECSKAAATGSVVGPVRPVVGAAPIRRANALTEEK